MGRRNQEIKIVVHAPENQLEGFCRENIEEFWIEKIADKMKDNNFTQQEWEKLFKE